jgi:hypothetical protein
MRRIPKWVFVAAPLGLAIFIAIGGGVVMYLWNRLMPELFGVRQVTFWQAFGLLALCRILFGGLGGSGGGGRYQRRRTIERWERMTPEEREKFRRGLRGRWGRAAAQDSPPTA